MLKNSKHDDNIKRLRSGKVAWKGPGHQAESTAYLTHLKTRIHPDVFGDARSQDPSKETVSASDIEHTRGVGNILGRHPYPPPLKYPVE